MNRRLALKCMGAIGLSNPGGARLALAQAQAEGNRLQGENATRPGGPKRGVQTVPLEFQRLREVFSAVAFSPDGRLLAAGGQSNFWQEVDIAALDGSVREPRIRTDGPNPTLHLWNADTGRVAQEYPAFSTEIDAVGFNSDGTRVLTAEDARYVAVREGIRKNTKDRRRQGAFSGQDLLVAPEGGLVKVWSILAGRAGPYPPLSHEETLVYLAAGRQYITAVDERGNVRVWDAASGRPWARYNNPHGKSSRRVLYTPAISLDATRIVILDGAKRSARFDLYAGPGREWKDPGDSCGPMAFSPDGNRFATWSLGGKPLLWDFKTMKVVREFEREPYEPGTVRRGSSAMAFSTDGAKLAFAWTEGAGFDVKDVVMHVYVWDVGSGRRLSETKATGSRVRALAFTSQGDLRVAIGGDATPQAPEPDKVVPLSVWHVPAH